MEDTMHCLTTIPLITGRSLDLAVSEYDAISRNVMTNLSNKDVPPDFLITLEPILTITFKDAIQTINRLLESAPREERPSIEAIKTRIQSDYHLVINNLASKVSSISIPILRSPDASRVARSSTAALSATDSSSVALATLGSSSQFNITFSAHDLLYHSLSAVKSDGQLVSQEDFTPGISSTGRPIARHFDVQSNQRHSCAANALQAMLFLHASPERSLFVAEDIDEILHLGIAQYQQIQEEINDELHSPDETIRTIAQTKAGRDGITLGTAAGYYRHKGLISQDESITCPISAANAHPTFHRMLTLLEPNQGVLINIFGRFVSITCKLNADGAKSYALFDSHSSYADRLGHTTPAMLSRFGSIEETIALLDTRLPTGSIPPSKTTIMQYSILAFDPGVFTAYTRQVDDNLTAFHAWESASPLELKFTLDTMEAAIATIRRLREKEAEKTLLAVKAAQATEAAATPAKTTATKAVSAKKGAALTYKPDITDASIRRGVIESFIPTISIGSGEALLATFQSLTEDVAGRAFLTRLFNGLLEDQDLTNFRYLIHVLEEIRLHVLVPQAKIEKLELTHIAIVVADIIRFDSKPFLPKP